MPTATLQSYVENAKLIMSKEEGLYIALGRTEPWQNEAMPDSAEEDRTDLDDIIGFKKPERISLCRPVHEGEQTSYPIVDYLGRKWALIPTEAAQDEGAYHIYMTTRIDPDDFPLGEYRQVGVYIHIDSDKEILLPNDPETEGRMLYFYDNRQRFNRTEQVSVTESFIINTRNTI